MMEPTANGGFRAEPRRPRTACRPAPSQWPGRRAPRPQKPRWRRNHGQPRRRWTLISTGEHEERIDSSVMPLVSKILITASPSECRPVPGHRRQARQEGDVHRRPSAIRNMRGRLSGVHGWDDGLPSSASSGPSAMASGGLAPDEVPSPARKRRRQQPSQRAGWRESPTPGIGCPSSFDPTGSSEP